MLLLAAACRAQIPGQPVPQFNGTMYAAGFGQWVLPQGSSPISGTILWPATTCAVSTNGVTFELQAGMPIRILDANPSQNEVTTISSVTLSSGECIVAAPMKYTHTTYSVGSGSAGLQEAIDYAQANQLATAVKLTADWWAQGGTAAMIGSASGTTAIQVVDVTKAPWNWYAWNGTKYALVPVGGGATLPASGVVCASSTTTGVACSSAQLVGAANLSPTTAFVSALIPPVAGDVTGTIGATSVVQLHFGTTALALGTTAPSTTAPYLGLSGGVLTGLAAPSGGCASGSNCIVNNPTGSQNVVQPAGTSLNANILSGRMYADQYSATTGIATAAGNCNAQQTTNYSGCTIFVPPTYANTENPQGWGATYPYGGQVAGTTLPSGSAVYDERNGTWQAVFHNPFSPVPDSATGMNVAVFEDAPWITNHNFGSNSPTTLRAALNVYAGGANFDNYFNGIPEYTYGRYYWLTNFVDENWSSGQDFGFNVTLKKHGVGDTVGLFESITCDGGVNTSTDEGCEGTDENISEDPNVFTGSITAVSGNTVTVNASIGGGTQGQDRLLVDTAATKTISGPSFAVASNASAQVPNSVTDTTASYPVSTMIELCYPGSDNGAGGSTACTAGNAPTGYIPPQALSTTAFSPATSITANVVASYTGLPTGFCTSANLQSSNSAAACYMAASGNGCLTSSEEYETVAYTYNATAQTITLNNLRFPHSNGMVFATGGLCGYAVEDESSIYSGGGTNGRISEVYPIEGSISANTIYYITQRTNEGYGLQTLGQNAGGSNTGQLCFSATGSNYALNGSVVSFNLSTPSGFINPFASFNGLTLTQNTANATYNGSYPVTWTGGNSFTYQPGTTPSGTAPTTGTVSYCNASYKIYPAARVFDVYNTANNTVDGTFHLYPVPATTAYAVGDPVMEPHYQQMQVKGNHVAITRYQPEEYYGPGDFTLQYQGLLHGIGSGLLINNTSATNAYLGFGGTYTSGMIGYQLSGMWNEGLELDGPPTDSAINIPFCRPSPIGCSSPLSNFNLFKFPPLPNGNPNYDYDALNYDPNYESGDRTDYTGRLYFLNNQFGLSAVNGAGSFGTFQAGYLVADQSATAPTVSTSNVVTTPLTNTPANAPSIVGTAGTGLETYYLVGHGAAGGSTLPYLVGGCVSGGVSYSVCNAPNTLSPTNEVLICAFHNPGFASYDVYKGGTSQLLGSANAPNGATYGQPANYFCVADQGQATTAQNAPTVNDTGQGKFAQITDLGAENAPVVGTGTTGKLIATTLSSLNTFLTGLSGCGTSGNLYSPGSAGCVAPTASTATQRGVNAVTDEGFVAGGTTDNSSKLQAWLNGLSASGSHELWVPCGTYLFAAGSTTDANGVTIIGEGTASENANGCVIFEQTMAAPLIWFDGSGQQLQGPRIENISFKGSGTMGEIGLRFSDYQNMQLRNVGLTNYTGAEYTTGTVAVTNGSTTLTGTSTVWTASMVPGMFSVGGLFQQVCGFTSATALTLCSAWQGPTNSAASYAIDTGIGILMDGGVSFTQYGDVYSLRGYNNRMAVMSLGGSSGSQGVSRVKFHSGNLQCNRVPDSMALNTGAFTDTILWAVASNNCAVHVNIEESHAMDIRGANFENDGTATVVPTCNAGTASQSCMVGVYVNGASATNTYANIIADDTFSGMGNAIQLGPNAYRTQVKTINYTDGGNTNDLVLPGTGSAADHTTITEGNMPQYDRAGTLTLATGTATHTFAGGPEGAAYPAAPFCTAVDTTAPGTAAYATTTTTVLTLHGTGSDVLQWHCDRNGQ